MRLYHPSPPPRPDRGDLTGVPSFLCESDIKAPSPSLEHRGGEYQRPDFPSTWGSAEEISKASRAITSQRPVSTYTAKDMDHIQLAAEYLEAMKYEEDAFSLYALLLKRLHQGGNQDRTTFLHAIIDTSRCVSTPGHSEIIQHHLRDQAQKLSEEANPCLLYQFLIQMALAETYSRFHDTPAVKAHLRKARHLILVLPDNGFHEIFTQLLQSKRSLDLVLYHSFRRASDPYAENLLPIEDPREFDAWNGKVHALERTMLYRVPGPFELKVLGTGDVMVNPCIRSCLQWCHQNLRQLKHVPGPWMEVMSSEKKFCRGRIATVHRMFLFTCLWNTWPKDPEATSLTKEADAWMSQAHSRLGVSATELLMTACAQIVHESDSSQGSGDFRFVQELMFSLRRGAERLLEKPDDALAKYFLNAFVQYRTLEEEGDPEWLKELRQESREGTVEQLERALHTTFSQTRELTTELTRSTRRLSTQVAEAAKHTTMASSLRSSNPSLLNFRNAREAMAERVRKLKGPPSVSSASFGDGSLSSRWSIWSVSQLSQTMERTSLGLQSTEPVA